MRRIVVYLSNLDKLKQCTDDTTDFPRWGNSLTFKTKMGNEVIFLVNDQLPKEDLEEIINELVSENDKVQIVYHSHMTISGNDSNADHITAVKSLNLKGQLLPLFKGRHEKTGNSSEVTIFTEHLIPIINRIYQDTYGEQEECNRIVNNDEFKKLWSVFEQEDELNKTLNILHQLASGKEIGDIDIKGTLVETNTEVREAFEALKDITNEKYEALFTCFKKTITNYAIDM